MNPTDPLSARVAKSRHRCTPTVTASIPSPQDPFNRNENKNYFTKSLTQSSFRPFDITGQACGRTTPMTPRKQVSINKQVTKSQNLRQNDTTEPFFSILSSRTAQIEKSGNRAALQSDIKLRQYDEQQKFDAAIESFLISFPEKPMHTSIENFISSKIVSGNVIFWYEIASIQRLYSPKLDISVSHNDAIVGFAFSNRELLKIPVASQHFSYNETIDGAIVNPKSALLLFPLQDTRDNIVGVVEIQKRFTDPTITDADELFATEFMKKFKTFSHWLLDAPIPNKTIVDLMNLYEIGQFLIIFQKKMKSIFHCKHAEIWRTDKSTSKSTRYVLCAEKIPEGDEGIIGSISPKLQLFNCSSNKMLSSYFERTDGREDTPLLAYPIYDRPFNSIFTVVLRGEPNKMFTTRDENILSQTAPFILTSFKNSIKFSEAITKNEQVKTLSDLTDILPDFGKRQKAQDIVTRAMTVLETVTSADRSTFYEVDHKTEILTSLYAKDQKDPIAQHFGRGLSGSVVRSADVHNTIDAYEDVRFDSANDLLTGYKTKSILTVPIIDATGLVVSVVQLINKKDWNPFNKLDVDSARLCGTICSCLINNAVVNGRLSRVTRKTSMFFSIIPDILKGNDYQVALQNILPSIREISKAEKVILYVADHAANVLVPVSWDGPFESPDIVPLTSGIAASCVNSAKSFFVNDISKDGRVDKLVDNEIRNICISPLISKSSENANESLRVIGVLEIMDKTKGEFDENDLTFIQCISAIFSLYFDNQKMQTVIKKGKVLKLLDRLISPNDRKLTKFPQKLVFPLEIQTSIDTLQFFSYDVESNEGDYKLLFYIFNKYNLLDRFRINNATFFTLIYKVKKTYRENFYHNWMHAIDSAQLLMFEIDKANLTAVLQPNEILALFIATFFMYSENDGTNNVFQHSSGTPIGSLFAHKPLTMSRCMTAIRVINNPKCNILGQMDSYDVKTLWKLVLKLMVEAVDGTESDVINQCRKILNSSTVDLNNNLHKELFMIMLIKCANHSPFCRPFGINLKWQPLIMNSMFYLGEQETSNGLDFSSRHNSRDHHIKPLAMIELIEKNVYPAFEVLTGMKNELKVLFETVKDNLQKWQDRRT